MGHATRRTILLALIGTVWFSACEPAAPPEPDRTLRYRVQAAPSTLDPVQASDNTSLAFVSLIFDGLVELVPGTLEVRPGVAESWTVSDDGRVYTFRLRDGVRFHNGRDVVAEDVVYSLRRGLTQATRSQKHDFLGTLEGADAFWSGETDALPGVTAPDPRTVELRLHQPYPRILTILAGEAGSIVPSEVYDDPDQAYLDNPVGCGPYRFGSRDPDISITLQRFDGHWKPAPPDPIETIEMRFIRDASTAMEEYRAGRIDFNYELPPGQRERIQEEFPDHFHHTQLQWIFYLAFNHARGPFREAPLLRRAVGHAIDRQFIVDQIQEGKDTVATGVIPPGMIGYRDAEDPFPYDLERARALLAEAGHPGGSGLPELLLLSGETQQFAESVERIRADLERIGLTVRVDMRDFGTFLSILMNRPPEGIEADLYRMTWFADWPDPDNFLGTQFITGAWANFGEHENTEFDELMAQARFEMDPEKRAALYSAADRMLIDSAALIPVYWYGQDILLRPSFRGLELGPLGEFAIPWEEMSVE